MLSAQAMNEWRRREEVGRSGGQLQAQVVGTCVPLVALCPVSSISPRQSIVTRVPGDARVSLLAGVL